MSLTLEDYYLIQGDSWIRVGSRLARLLCISKAIILKHLFQWNIIEHAGCKLCVQTFPSCTVYSADLAWQRSKGWPSIANKTLCLHKFRTTDLLSETESRKNSWLEIASHFGECGLPLPSPVGPV